MKTKILIFVLIVSTIAASAQSAPRKNRFPVGTYHTRNQNIYGISGGLYSGVDEDEKPRNVQTNGFRLEIVGLGLFVPLIPSSPVVESDEQLAALMAVPPSERINGFNLSPAGTVCDCITNGVSAGLIGQINRQVSGVSVSIVMNFSQKHNGVQLAMFNESYAMNGVQMGLSNSGGRARGLQIGLVNHASNFKGLQVGLWNVNQKRKMPVINWNFKD